MSMVLSNIMHCRRLMKRTKMSCSLDTTWTMTLSLIYSAKGVVWYVLAEWSVLPMKIWRGNRFGQYILIFCDYQGNLEFLSFEPLQIRTANIHGYFWCTLCLNCIISLRHRSRLVRVHFSHVVRAIKTEVAKALRSLQDTTEG